jgi:hypothetical protein
MNALVLLFESNQILLQTYAGGELLLKRQGRI